MTVHDLCDYAFQGELGYYARVPFVLLSPTDDPRVFEYRPGKPPQSFAPLVRFEFRESPTIPLRKGVILGWVDRIEPDDAPRKSRHLGVVVLTSCVLAPSP